MVRLVARAYWYSGVTCWQRFRESCGRCVAVFESVVGRGVASAVESCALYKVRTVAEGAESWGRFR
jgi:hypothetical protein